MNAIHRTYFFGILVSIVAGGAIAGGCSSANDGGSTTQCTGDQGKTYAVGESYVLDCSSCSCTASGPVCTGGACLDSGSDAGTDAPGDVGAIDAKDFGGFQYNWYGTGVSESFLLDQDCGVSTSSTSSGTPPKSGAGTVAAADCEGFEKLVTSAPVVSALSDKSPRCTDLTDDNGTYTLKLASGPTIGRTATACSSTEPFATLKSEMHRIGNKYATSTADAGADADADADAHD